MSLPVILGLLGLLYIVVFGGLSLMRREGLSARFAVEALILTGIFVLLTAVLSIPINPVVFILILYLITMRVRILVDVANFFAGRGSYSQAERVYSLATGVGPDTSSKLIVEVNHSIMLLQSGKLDEAITAFSEILKQANTGYLGVKYESATHYNLGVAYLRKDNHSMATAEFNAAIDAWPASVYAHRAQQALKRQHRKEDTPAEDQSTSS